MIREKCEITENIKIAKDIYKMTLLCDTSSFTKAGQFIDIALDGFYLRRPISVCDYDDKSITIIYKAVGEGTKVMSALVCGVYLDCLLGLGNGFDDNIGCKKPLIIGGGVGVPPLYKLAKKLISNGAIPLVVLGFNSKDDVFFAKEFKALGCAVEVTTIDGSMGTKGFVTDIVRVLSYDYFYACGPLPMLKAIANIAKTSGQISMEERMGCGFGACMGCSIMTLSGSKRVCKDGPVFVVEELLW